MRFEALLGRNVRSFWATSYSFDLRLFDQYLLRRLAQSPLNAVVLADHDKLASVWEQLHEGETYLARQIGRRYLLRGIRLPGGGAFHPKTYLFARADHATLLVGSGNLTRGGIDHGHETFTTFTTQRDEDVASMRAWAQWMGQLVQIQGDQLLADRWVTLRESCPWMLGSTTGTRFLTNQDRPLSAQLIEQLPETVSELHVTAPFFDREAFALQRLLRACSPEHLTLYIGAGLSVDGPSLRAVLGELSEVRVRRFEPRSFVHAKLVGAVSTNGTGLLLSGSPNLSRAALTLTYREPYGNCEVAVLRPGTAEQVRDAFESSGLALIDEPLDWLADFEYDDDHPTLSRPFVLRSARWREDGRIQLDWGVEDRLPVGTGLSWQGTATIADITAEGTTAEPLDQHDPHPLLVNLTDRSGEAVSNRVVVDDPAALRETLLGTSGKSSSRPSEMEGIEMLPLVRLVLWAHDKLIFDPEETAAFRRAQEAAGEAADAEDAGDFWERYATEELQFDPRTQSYKPLTAAGTSTQPVDELLRELQRLLHAAPGTNAAHVLRLVTVGPDPGGERGTGTPWSMEARQRIRAYHLLLRWATAVADPRHALVAPQAPVINYETLLGILFLAWVNEALEIKQLRKLLLTLLEGFIGGAPGKGFLGRAQDAERSAALATLDPGFIEIAAGLAYVALAHPGWREDIYDWQPKLQRGVELGVVLPGTLSESVVLHLTGETVNEKAIDELLAKRLDWVDETTWCKRLAGELELGSVILGRFNNPKVSLVATVTGSPDPLHDTRLLTVARRTLDFRHVQAVAVRASKDTFVFEPGASARARVAGKTFKTATPVSASRLREVEDQGGAWSDVLETDFVRVGTA